MAEKKNFIEQYGNDMVRIFTRCDFCEIIFYDDGKIRGTRRGSTCRFMDATEYAQSLRELAGMIEKQAGHSKLVE
jgi:hypothetical protein